MFSIGQFSYGYECTSEDKLNSSTLKKITQFRLPAFFDETARVEFYRNYGSLVMCPTENYNNQDLTPNERKNLLEILKVERINGFQNYIADNLNFINLDSELESYRRVHSLIYGANTPLPSSVQLIIQNKELYKQDRKKQCTEKYVDTTHMGPVRDQGDIGWCYAYAAADLMSFHAQKTLSAVDIAILNNNFAKDPFKDRLDLPEFLRSTEHMRPFYEKYGLNTDEMQQTYIDRLFDSRRDGGDESEALGIAMERGVCLEADMPSRVSNASISLYEELQRPASLADNSQRMCINENNHSSLIFPNLNNRQLTEIASQASPFYRLFALRQKNCRQTYKIKNKKIIKASSPQFGKAFNLLDTQLDKNSPAMISYDFRMISSENGAHASIVVGRRYNERTGQCEYKIRNSWGDYNHYEPSTRTRHTDGYYWVSESNLQKNLMDVTILN